MVKVYKKNYGCLFLLLVSLTSPIYSTAPLAWANEHKKEIAGGCAIATAAGVLIGAHYILPGLMNRYQKHELQRMRKQIAHRIISSKNELKTHTALSNDEQEAFKKKLSDKKECLSNKWKTHIQKGISISGAASFNGRSSIANAVGVFHLELNGEGILRNCFSFNSTYLEGNAIAESCNFKGDVIIGSGAQVASFEGCFLGSVAVQGSETIVELKNTVINQDIVFAKEGTVIIDADSVIGGSVINGTVIRV